MVTLRYVEELEYYDPDTGEIYGDYEDVPQGANFVTRPVKFRDVEYEVAALVTVPSALSYRYYGSDEFILNDETFVADTGTDSVMYYAFDITDDANAAMEEFLADYTENVNPALDYESKATYAGEFESMRTMFLLLGGALSFIVGLVGILNFFNAVLTGIIARRREMAGTSVHRHDGKTAAGHAGVGGAAVRPGGCGTGPGFDRCPGAGGFPGGGRAVLVLHLSADPDAFPAGDSLIRPAGSRYPCPYRSIGGQTHHRGTPAGRMRQLSVY